MVEKLQFLPTYASESVLDNSKVSSVVSPVPAMLSGFFSFFSIQVFFHNHSQITGLQEKGVGIALTPHYHFYLLHRQLDISR